MLVNDREETRYQAVPPQRLALRVQIKQSFRGKDSVCIAKPSYIRSRGRRIFDLTPQIEKYALPRIGGRIYLF